MLNRAAAEEMWASAAAALDARLVVVGDGFFEITKDGARTRVYEQVPALNDDVAVRLADDKSLVYRLLEVEGVPIPEHLEFSLRELSHAVEFLETANAPCVVKPARGGAKGFGVTSQLQEPADLRRAARWAARFSDRLLIERQCEGAVYRVLVLDGIVLDAVRRQPPRVTGDGRSTIAELVEAEYERRVRSRGIAALRPFVIDLDSLLTLRRQGLSPRSVVEAGQTVTAKNVTNQNRVEDNETVLDPISRDLTANAVAAAAVLGLRLAGVDVVIPEANRDLYRAAALVIDVNARPGLWHHYRVRDRPNATDVAVDILTKLLTDPR
jgi:cyanophycin synthetase